MKAYLVLTGTLFGLLAAMHLAHAIRERAQLATDPVYYLGMTALGAAAAFLAAWAFWLLRRPQAPRP